MVVRQRNTAIETSDAFERQIHKIHELLLGSDAVVTWDDHLPDPDNPAQLRQVDITIRKDGTLSIVECRLTKRRQDVKWIEELIGRRQSLAAKSAMAVSAAGFTIGAQRKAARYGVILRDLLQLSDDEITSWGSQVALTLYYYQYSDVSLFIGFSAESIATVDSAKLKPEVGSHPILQSLFSAAAVKLDTFKLLAKNDTRTVPFIVVARPEMFLLGGEPVLEIRLKGKARLVPKPIASPAVLGFGSPKQAPAKREAIVERFALGETNIVHNDDRVAIDIDLSAIELPPLSQIRFFRTNSAQEMDHESFALTNPERLRVAGPLTVEVYALQRY